MKIYRCLHGIEAMCNEQGRQLLLIWFMKYLPLTTYVIFSEWHFGWGIRVLWTLFSSLKFSLKWTWYRHVECSNGAVKTAFHIQVEGKGGPGRTKMTWKQLTERDCREWKLSVINPHDRHTWRSGVRSAMRAASQLSGRGPTDVDVAPVPAC